jgi:hypothetical protein
MSKLYSALLLIALLFAMAGLGMAISMAITEVHHLIASTDNPRGMKRWLAQASIVSVTRPPDRRDSTPVGAGDQRSEFCINFARHHRFPPPWTVEDIGAAVVVTDSAGQKLACVLLWGWAGCAFNTTAMSRTRLPVAV